MSVNLYQLRVATNSETHYSIAEEHTRASLEDLYQVLNEIVSADPKDGVSFSFNSEKGGGKTFIPAHRIRYITVLRVDPSE